jgi:hypothetical protein
MKFVTDKKEFDWIKGSYLSPLQDVQVQAHLFVSHVEHFRQTPILQSGNKLMTTFYYEIHQSRILSIYNI